jgi:hypothetical protein
MSRMDETPLPPPRPPTIDFPAFDPRNKKPAKRSRLPWLVAIACAASTGFTLRHLIAVERRDRQTLGAARDEAAEQRAARFVAEAEARRLAVENQHLRVAALPDAATPSQPAP